MTNEKLTNRQAIGVLDGLRSNPLFSEHHRQAFEIGIKAIKALEQEPKTGHCKDCKWWRDSDGTYRRGVHAESQCPINRREVFEGNGYCYMFEPQESEG